MSRFFDLLIPRPIPDPWLKGLLFGSFFLHFIFVLFTIGTALLALAYYVRSRFGGDATVEGWDKHFLSSLFIHKSLAIVLGIGPILLMQVLNSIPFVTANNLLAPLWMGLIVFLISSLILLEVLNERSRPGRWGYLVVGILGVSLLLMVPGTFTAVLATTERPSAWRTVFERGGMPPALALHWLLRFGHVVAAALVFTAAFHLTSGRWPEKRAALGRWIIGGIAVQVPIGVALLLTLPRSPARAGTTTLLLGIAAAMVALWLVSRASWRAGAVRPGVLATLLLTLLGGMLLTRQFLQDALLVPLNQQLDRNAAVYQASLSPAGAPELERYRLVSEVPYDNPLTVYARSCSFCHGAVANGQGHEAANLEVPPADLTGVRVGDAELTRILRSGIPGTAMPFFRFYTENQLGSLVRFLREPMGLGSTPEPLDPPPSPSARAEAHKVFEESCSVCHGRDGRRTELSLGFRPQPPDLTVYALSPSRELEVITNGYPGTMMRSFASLPEPTRRALVEKAHSFYRGEQ